MTPEDCARATATPIGQISSHFMLDPATYALGAEIGFAGADFYVAGRGGVLGDVPGEVVAAAFVVFNPDMVRDAWQRAGDVMPRREAAERFAACLHEWAQRIPDDIDVSTLAELAGAIAAEASPAGAPIFAAWRALGEPDDPKALAAHRMNALRELRFAKHAAAVLTNGLEPLEAVLVKTPHMAPIFGWTGELPDVNEKKAAWEAAEEATDQAMAQALAVLGDADRARFAELAGAVHAATS